MRDKNRIEPTLAEVASFEVLGHTEYVSPYLICSQCATEVVQEISMGGES